MKVNKTIGTTITKSVSKCKLTFLLTFKDIFKSKRIKHLNIKHLTNIKVVWQGI